MTLKQCLIPALTLAFCGGCLPEKRIVWSPDGSKACVAAEKGLYFVDAGGRVLSQKLSGLSIRAAWFSDSKRLAVVQQVEVAGWKELSSMFSPAESAVLAQRSEELRRRILAFDGDWNQFEVDPEGKLTPGMEAAMLVHMRDHAAADVRERVGGKWKDLEGLRPRISRLQICELQGDSLREGKVLVKSIEQIMMPRVSPRGTAIAYLRRSERNPEALAALFAVSAGGGPEVHVTENASMNFEWSPDGRSLAYIHAPSGPDGSDMSIQLGAICTSIVGGEDGSLKSEASAQKDLAGLLFNEALQVKWLDANRLIFSSAEVTLPVTARDMPQRWSIFVVDRENPATVQRLLARDFTSAMDMQDPRFELSPDRRRVIIPGPEGQLYVYDFSTGETSPVETPSGASLVSFPDWRTNDEFVFALAQGKDEGEGQVYLWKAGSAEPFGKNWPKDLTDWIRKN